MKLVIILFMAAACFSCNSMPSAISEQLKDADSLVIHIRSTSPTDTAAKLFNTKDKRALEKMTHYLNGKAAENHQCNYDGNMVFYAGQQQLQSVDFNYRDQQCRHFAYTLNGEAMQVRMSNEGAAFFNALETGSDHY